MTTFKGYRKVPTSDTMLRIDKRERIISCILGGATLEKMPVTAYGQTKDFAKLIISEHVSNRDYFDWKIRMIQETEWLTDFEIWEEDDILYASWCDARKLRIYYKWIFLNKKKTFSQVLKYMHSPLFAAILVMDSGAMDKSKELLIDLGLNYGESADLLKAWFKDILNLRADIIKTPESHYLFFDQLACRKLLSVIKPVVQNIPSMHEELYPHALR